MIQLPDTRIAIFMEYIQGSTLQEYLDSKLDKSVTEEEAQKIMY